MFCEQCGHKLREGARFCEQCGWEVNIIQTPNKQTQNNEVKSKPPKRKAIIGIGAIALVLLCVICYFAFFHVDPKVAALDGLWKPMDDGFTSDVEIHKGVMTFYDQDGIIKDCDDSYFTVEYKDGSSIRWKYAVSERGLMWLCYQIEDTDTDSESELDSKPMTLYYNDEEADDSATYWYDYTTSVISVMNDTDSNDKSYKRYLAGGIWCAEDDQDTFDADTTTYISFEWDDEGYYHTDYRLPVVPDNGDEHSLEISSMYKVISNRGSYLISMVPLEDDLCAVYFYGDTDEHTALFSRF